MRLGAAFAAGRRGGSKAFEFNFQPSVLGFVARLLGFHAIDLGLKRRVALRPSLFGSVESFDRGGADERHHRVEPVAKRRVAPSCELYGIRLTQSQDVLRLSLCDARRERRLAWKQLLHVQAENQVGDRACRPSVTAGKRVNPVQAPEARTPRER